MQDTPASSAPGGPQPRASAWRWVWRGLLALLLLATVLTGLMAWLTSGAGLRWLSEQPLQFGATHVELEDVRGSLWSGLRIARLQVQSPKADVDARKLHLPHTKNGHERAVPLSSRAVELLSALPRRDDGRVFSMRPDSVTQAFERAAKQAGIKDVRFHDSRHEATSRLADKLQAHELAKVTGHRDMRMVLRYYHPRAEDLAKKLD